MNVSYFIYRSIVEYRNDNGKFRKNTSIRIELIEEKEY